MKNFQKTKGGRVAVSLLAALVLILVLSVGSSEAGPCERALGKCLIDAGVPSLASALASGAIGVLFVVIMAQFCGNGYLFCIQYCQ
jgi:hypothetical protein